VVGYGWEARHCDNEAPFLASSSSALGSQDALDYQILDDYDHAGAAASIHESALKPGSMATLLSLSTEVICMMVDLLLTTDDIFRFRQTCKYAAQHTTARVVRDYFQCRTVMFERQSLQALSDMTEHPDFGPCNKELRICTCHLLPIDELSKIRARSSFPWHWIKSTTSLLDGASCQEANREQDEGLSNDELLDQDNALANPHQAKEDIRRQSDQAIKDFIPVSLAASGRLTGRIAFLQTQERKR
jgi:hypothetical protein